MAYIKTNWQARQGANLNRFAKSQETENSVVLTPNPGEITVPGTPFTAENMNHIEEGIAQAQPRVITAICATTAATAAKAVTITGYTLAVGDLFAITYTNGNTAASATININGSGAKAVSLGGGAPTGASGSGAHYVAAGRTALYYYNGTYMCLMGSQGEGLSSGGRMIYAVSAATTSPPAGAKAGDWILNQSANTYTIGGFSTAAGRIVEITSLSPFTCVSNGSTGNIRGPTGATGATGATGPQGEPGVSVVNAKIFFWNTASNMTNISSISGMAVGDFVCNSGNATRTILGVSAAVGDIVKATSATAGTAAGNIRGPNGADGVNAATVGSFPNFTVGVILAAQLIDNNVHLSIGASVTVRKHTNCEGRIFIGGEGTLATGNWVYCGGDNSHPWTCLVRRVS